MQEWHRPLSQRTQPALKLWQRQRCCPAECQAFATPSKQVSTREEDNQRDQDGPSLSLFSHLNTSELLLQFMSKLAKTITCYNSNVTSCSTVSNLTSSTVINRKDAYDYLGTSTSPSLVETFYSSGHPTTERLYPFSRPAISRWRHCSTEIYECATGGEYLPLNLIGTGKVIYGIATVWCSNLGCTVVA